MEDREKVEALFRRFHLQLVGILERGNKETKGEDNRNNFPKTEGPEFLDDKCAPVCSPQ